LADNGSGIAEEDLPLAFASHPTSNENLFRIGTLGGRNAPCCRRHLPQLYYRSALFSGDGCLPSGKTLSRWPTALDAIMPSERL
jgi:hypothetical protein